MVEQRRRPGREDKQLVAGHFPRLVAKELRIIAANEDTTVQALLGEAIAALLISRDVKTEIVDAAKSVSSDEAAGASSAPLLKALGVKPKSGAKKATAKETA